MEKKKSVTGLDDPQANIFQGRKWINIYQGLEMKQQLELDKEQQTGSK